MLVFLTRRTVVLRKDRFDANEGDFYEAMYTQSQAQFDAYVEAGTLLNNYSHVFDLLIKLRQVRPPAHQFSVACSWHSLLHELI